MLNLVHLACLIVTQQPSETPVQVKARQLQRWSIWRQTQLEVAEIQQSLTRTQDMMVLTWSRKPER